MDGALEATREGVPSSSRGRGPRIASDLREIVSDLWHYRDLLLQLTVRDIKVRYKQSVMGFAWAILMPVLVVGAGVIVRIAVSTLAGESIDAAVVGGIAVKSLPWAFFIGALSFANTSLVSNNNLVTKVYFPREVLPLSSVLAQAFDTSIAAAALCLLLPFLGAQLSWALLWVLPLAVLLFMLTAATGLALSCANLFFRDVKYLAQLLITFGIFLTPVFFEPAMFPPTGALALMLNPLAPIVEGLRLAVVEGHSLLAPWVVTSPAGGTTTVWAPWYLVYSGCWAVGGLLAVSLAFHRLEYLFAEYA